MYRKKWLIFSLLGLLMMMFSLSLDVVADDMSFSVATKQSQNQRDKTKSYYDLRVKPGTTEELEVDIQNRTDKKMEIEILANTAVTNDNGVIDYSKTAPKLDNTLKIPFATLVGDIPDVTLEPKETKSVKIPVKIPDKPFDGIILGGLHFIEKNRQESKSEIEGVGALSNYSYIIGVRLSENDDPVPLNLNLLNVSASQRNYQNMIAVRLENPEPRIVSHLEIQTAVYQSRNVKEPVYQSNTDDLSMAPNSSFNYGIPLKDEKFKPGDYILHLVAKSNNREFEFEENFTITKEEADKFNAKMVDYKEKPSPIIWIIVVVIILVVVVAGLVWIIFKQKTQQKNHSPQTEREKRMLEHKKEKSVPKWWARFKKPKKETKSSRHERITEKKNNQNED